MTLRGSEKLSAISYKHSAERRLRDEPAREAPAEVHPAGRKEQ